MPLPKAIRAQAPERLRDDRRLRAIALAVGVVPPRSMHTRAEAGLLARLASKAQCVVELGVYEGSSAMVFIDALGPGAELHLVDPYTDESGWSMSPGWQGSAAATKIAVWRRARRAGLNVRWWIARSQDVGRVWDGTEVDLVFVDGDHSPQGCREDWDVWHPHVRPGGCLAFHDARLGQPNGDGSSSPGPTSVVDELFRCSEQPGWRIADEVDSLVVVQRASSPSV